MKIKLFKPLYLIFFLPILCVDFLFAYQMPSNQGIVKINQLMSNEKLDEAIEMYLSWIKSGFKSKSIFYNLGILYERKGNVGLAMFYLKKAEKLAPVDLSVKGRIISVQEKIKDRFLLHIEHKSSIDLIISPWQFWTLQKSGIFLLIGIWIYFIHFMVYRFLTISKNKYFYKQIQYIQLLVMAFLLIQCLRILNFSNRNEAIIISPEVKVYQGADKLSPIIQTVHAGLPVLFDDRIGDWIKIKLNNGQIGWIKNNQLSAKI
jgi:tetratricopeptide (TPR) repeat protein